MEHQGVEFHDSTLRSVRRVGTDAVLEMRVYVHSSKGRPGWDDGLGWYQDAEIVVVDAQIDEEPDEDLLDIYDGSVRVAQQLFENLLPLPCEMVGQLEIVLSGDGGTLIAKGRGIRVSLKGEPGPVEEFRR